MDTGTCTISIFLKEGENDLLAPFVVDASLAMFFGIDESILNHSMNVIMNQTGVADLLVDSSSGTCFLLLTVSCRDSPSTYSSTACSGRTSRLFRHKLSARQIRENWTENSLSFIYVLSALAALEFHKKRSSLLQMRLMSGLQLRVVISLKPVVEAVHNHLKCLKSVSFSRFTDNCKIVHSHCTE